MTSEQVAENIRLQLAQKERDDLDHLSRAQTGGPMTELEELRDALRITDQLLNERNRLLALFDCPAHGPCVPFAIEEVLRMRKNIERSYTSPQAGDPESR
jgi:hypothetical protein